jgi:hypothetical protein
MDRAEEYVSDVRREAQSRLDKEKFEADVEAEKQRLRTHRPWHVRLFPWRIKLERR